MMGSRPEQKWRWLFLALIVILLLFALASFCGYESGDLREDLSELFEEEDMTLVDELGGPSQACGWFMLGYGTEHLARLEYDSFDDRDWREEADRSGYNITGGQMEDGVNWLLDNCWE